MTRLRQADADHRWPPEATLPWNEYKTKQFLLDFIQNQKLKLLLQIYDCFSILCGTFVSVSWQVLELDFISQQCQVRVSVIFFSMLYCIINGFYSGSGFEPTTSEFESSALTTRPRLLPKKFSYRVTATLKRFSDRRNPRPRMTSLEMAVSWP